nr:PREDICTED: uncharacterized protein LOC109033209 [Bemisia tabaci]
MPTTCVAVQCTHNGRNCKLKKFPTEESRAKLWDHLLRRANFTRKDFHRICACHFDKNQFDKLNGRLKKTAIPTIFPTHKITAFTEGDGPDSFEYNYEDIIPVPPPAIAKSFNISGNISIKPPLKFILPKSVETPQNLLSNTSPLGSTFSLDGVKFISSPVLGDIECLTEIEIPQPIDQDLCVPKPTFILPKPDSEQLSALSATTEESDASYVINPCKESDSSQSENHPRSESDETRSDEIEALRKERDNLRRELYRLRKKMTEYTKMLHNFSDDERACLSGKKVRQWSEETYNKCLEIRLAVGKKGYDFLLKKGYPLVSYASLCRFIQKLAEKKELSQSVAADLAEETSSIPNSPSSSSPDDDSDEYEEIIM